MTTLTVTATASGAGAANGILLRVVVLRNPAASQTGATATQSAAAAHDVTFNTTAARSVTYGAVANGTNVSLTAVGSTVWLDDYVDNVNTTAYGTLTGGATGTPGSVTLGTNASFQGGCAVMEVLAASTAYLYEDASSPASVAVTGAKTCTTASFTPPAGTILIAMVAANGVFGQSPSMAITDSHGLTWHKAAEANAATQLYAGVFYAFAPALAPYAIGHTATAANISTAVITAGTTTATGDAIIVGASTSNTDTVTGVTDSQGNAYVKANSGSSQYTSSLWVALDAAKLTSSVDTITVTYSAADTGAKNVAAIGCSSIASVKAVDVTPAQASNAGSTTPSVTSGTLAQAAELVVAWEDNANGGGAISWSGSPAATVAGFQSGTNQFSSMAAFVTAATTSAAYHGTITSAKWDALAVSLAPVPAETQFMLIPAYSFPPSVLWADVIAAAPSTAILVANVDSGPGSGVESNYTTVIAAAQNAGIMIVGYVYTLDGARSSAAVEADVDAWNSFYGVTNIFFDQSNCITAFQSYYQGLVNYVHTATPGSTVVLNPGVIPDQVFFSTVISAQDIILVCEDDQQNFPNDVAAAPSWLFSYPASQKAVTVNGCNAVADMISDVNAAASVFDAKYVFITDDILYGTLPSYFADEVAYLAGTYSPASGPSGGTVVNQWGAATAQNPGNPQPALLPLALALNDTTVLSGGGTPTAGNWMFAVAAWRQNAGSVATISYNSTVSVRDDAHNFWIPVSSVLPETGIVRSSVWMAPAFRVPQHVFASPTAYQAGLALTVFEVTADCPWYEVASITSTYANQGTAITLSQSPSAGLFTVGAITYDLSTVTPAYTHAGFTEQAAVTASSGIDHTGDLIMQPFTGTTTGTAMTLSATGSGTADWAEVLVSVHGVTDGIAFPYTGQFPMPNWPALVFEAACGATLNANWSFNSGITPWSGQNGATISSVVPYTFGNSARSMLVTPSGTSTNQGAISEMIQLPAQQPVAGGAYTAVYTADYEPGSSPATEAAGPSQFDILAEVNVPSGWAGGLAAGVFWYNSAGSAITASGINNIPVTGSQQQISGTFAAPATATAAQLWVQMTGGTVPTTTLMYVGYAALSIPGVFGAVPEDQITWIDLSARTITQAPTRYSRGIQYEQQSLEAGELEIPLWNNDGYLTAGNNQSPYYPYAGQPDVPVRLRAIWPRSLTPYSVLYTGYSDDVKYQRDETSLTSYITLTAADVWSRLTAQMLTAVQQEMIADLTPGGTGGFWPCNDAAGAVTAANLAPTALGPLVVQDSKSGTGNLNIAFGSTDITLAGDPGGTGWLLDSLTSGDGTIGASLLLYPQNNSSLPPPSGGVTVEFWVLIGTRVASITWDGSIAACVGAKGRVWELHIGAPTGGTDGQLIFTVWDKITNVATNTVVNPGDNWGTTSFITIEFTQATWAVYQDGDILDSGTCDFSNVTNGYVFNGLNVPWQGLTGNGFNGVLQDIAVYPLSLPQPRIVTQYDIGLNAAQDELDTSRVARVTGYGGFAPVLAMLGILGVWPDADVDPVTQITDTIGQVVSSYLTNIASSTLAGLFTDGTGALVYRRRLEWYDRPVGQWTLGELAPLALNVNPYFATGVASWTAASATLAWDSDGAQFSSGGAALLTANGAGPVALTPENQAATAGESYSCTIAAQCPAGYATGAYAQITWVNSGGSVISSVTGTVTPLVAGAWTVLIVTGQAPAATTAISVSFVTSGTPSAATQFLVSSVVTAVYPGEAPYLRDEKLSDDRAQMYNSAVITQSGTGQKTTFSGTSFNFTPTSGITVTAVNETSVSQRGNVPYTATAYLQNTAQNTPEVAFFTDEALAIFPDAFVPAEGSIEDFANWIINTLGTPVLRGESATLTPGATWQDMITALQAEVGDTVTLNLRTLGAPALSLLMYLSAIQADIDVRTGWTTTYQLSPAPQASILLTDDPSNGALDGSSLLGW